MTHSFLEMFERQVDETPDAPAIRLGSAMLTYRELDRRSNQLAHHLRELGVGPDVLVGVCLERSFDMVAAVLAVLKAGGAYAPLDAAYPRARLAFMLSDTRAPVVLTQSSLVEALPTGDARVLCLDRDRAVLERAPVERVAPRPVGPDSLAYVIYTSGSTGNPKGVALGRAALSNLIAWQRKASMAGPGTRTLQFAPLSFDVHFQEMFSTWTTGGTLVLVTDELRLDAVRLLELISSEGIERLFLPFVALQNLCEIATGHRRVPSCLKEVVTAGEQLKVTPHIARFFEQLPGSRLHNHYGPSETHVVTAHVLTGPPAAWPPLPPIGKAIDGVRLYIVDEQLRQVPQGETGELLLGGVCVARGYLNRPDLTGERFLADPFAGEVGARLYRSGDLARFLADGSVEFLGRIDGQVKIRGYRVELGEIEVALCTHPRVKQVAVIAREDDPGDRRLVAYVVLDGPIEHLTADLHRHLTDKVPDYMLPSAFVTLDALPRTPSGKVDRLSLPRPGNRRPELSQAFVAPAPGLEQTLATLWRELIKLDRVGVNDNFFELGGNSLLALQLVARLRQEQGIDVPVVRLFETPTVAGLALWLEGGQAATSLFDQVEQRARRRNDTPDAVAVIGMAGRFPGAPDITTYWKNLLGGVESVSFFSEAEIDPQVPAAERADPRYVRAHGVVDDADRFDVAFFGITPKEAELIDPQQRLFLETSWHALEHAGQVPDTFPGVVGVYAGIHNNSYYLNNVLHRQDLIERVGAFTAMVGNEKDYVATRVAHKLGLTGPAISVHTACSTSLVAVCQAVHALQAFQCDMALAGGAAVTVPQRAGYLYQEGGMLSDDGHCRPFDARAQGTIFSDGVGVVVLKRLRDALEQGDTIHAVIRGAALNNDGSDKVSFAGPSVSGQAAVIALAQANAGVDPRSISYVEAHGTATPLGDPVEVEGLTQAFRARTADKQFCWLGSTKSNFGHLVAAAGVTGLIKTVLSLEHEQLPPVVHFEAPNPKIDFANSPFRVVSQLTPWPRTPDAPRRAGVSSFGVGGTNAHAVLEEAPPAKPSGVSRPKQVLLVSAKSAAALDRATANLAQHLEAGAPAGVDPGAWLADVAYTLETGRKGFPHRRFCVAGSGADAAQALRAKDPRKGAARKVDARPPPVVFMFPGQGSQYVGMGSNLYRHEPAFRALVDTCAEGLRPYLGRDLREVIFPEDLTSPEAAEALRATSFTQSALFTIEYALANVWWSWGVRPAAMMGHSVGEFVAACMAGVFSLDDALKLVARRGLLMQSMPPGTMLSVRLPAAEVARELPADVSVASINGPSLCVVAGPADAVAALQKQLEARQVITRPLHTSHAFHSAMMDPAVSAFAEVVSTVRLSPPRIPIVSTATGTWLTPEQATDPRYWAQHLRQTVRFSDAVAEMWREPERLLLEVGPRTTLATLARQQVPDKARSVAVSSLGDTCDNDAEWSAMLMAVGQLWLSGITPEWARFHEGEERRRLPLPAYPFERTRCWVEPAREPASPARAPATSSAALPLSPAIVGAGAPSLETALTRSDAVSTPLPSQRKDRLVTELKQVLEELSGLELQEADPSASFLELGLDSLALTQVALDLQRRYGVNVTFRQLLEDMPTTGMLAEHLDHELPKEQAAAPIVASAAVPPLQVAPPAAAPPAPAPVFTYSAAPVTPAPIAMAGSSDVRALIEQQLRLMQQQLALLGGAPMVAAAPATWVQPPPPLPAPTPAVPVATPTVAALPVPAGGNGAEAPTNTAEAGPQTYDPKKAFGAIARIFTNREELTPKQRRRLETLTQRYNEKTRRSKEYTQQHRAHLSDPRVVTGFRPVLKELIYQIVMDRSSGCRLWDLDGNEYVDALNGFGSNFFGYSPSFITEALKKQIERGYELGPQHPLAGEVAEKICKLTGMDRVGLCNTGSEAVMGAMRVARTVTGRTTIAIFSGAYHGIFDEVIVRGTKSLRSIPAAPGIMPGAVQNVLVLDYGTDETLNVLRSRAGELAAVLVEPVQSRRPDFQPREFLHEVRRITEQSGSALIFDEVITGFRLHPGGAQAHFGVRADLATYGKVVGGGQPIGVIAGKRAWMDALDGGHWQFGDASIPTVGVTYFAGTFVRHPLALAAANASLDYLIEHGPSLQANLNEKTATMAAELNGFFHSCGVPMKIKHFGSLWKAVYTEDQAFGDLLFCYLRDRGVHIWDGFPCFLTLGHTDADVAFIVQAFKDCVAEMQDGGFLPAPPERAPALEGFDSQSPPVPEARLGRDRDGSPAWFVPKPNEPGKFLKFETKTSARKIDA